MAKSKKVDDKPAERKMLSIDIEAYVRTRDSVVTGLATLQDAIQTLSKGYITHTNAVLEEHGVTIDVASALARLGENPLLSGLGGLQGGASLPAAGTPPKSPVPEGKKEKKKRIHDPNAPKRPLTPYFLYMQTARPIIAADLGDGVPKGAVGSEGVARWNAMADHDKLLWTQAYTDNLRLYNARMHSYKSGNLAAKDMDDEIALSYAEENNITARPDPTIDDQLAAEASAAAAVIEEAPKTPKAKSSRKKGGKASPPPAAAPSSAAIVPTAKSTPAAEKAASPPLKRKRTSAAAKKADEAAASVEDAPTETPKTGSKAKGTRAKKAKTDA